MSRPSAEVPAPEEARGEGEQRAREDGLPVGEEKRRAVKSMFDAIAPKYDLLNRILTLRLDVRWRRRLVRELALPPPSRVADLACGTGDLCRELAARGHIPFGFDLSMGMLRSANCPQAPLVHADALALPLRDGCLDGASCGFALRNLVEIPPLFEELARTVRPGGRIGLLEVDEPANPLLRRCHSLYFGRAVPAVGALLSDRAAYQYLPESTAYLPPPGELASQLTASGFEQVKRSRLTGGVAQLITATRGSRRSPRTRRLDSAGTRDILGRT